MKDGETTVCRFLSVASVTLTASYRLSLLVRRFGRLGCFRPQPISRAEHSVHNRDEDHREAADEGGFGRCGGSERLHLRPEANGIEQADLGGEGGEGKR